MYHLNRAQDCFWKLHGEISLAFDHHTHVLVHGYPWLLQSRPNASIVTSNVNYGV